MPLYRPRCAATIYVPVQGDPTARKASQASDAVFTLNVRPTKVRLVSNDANNADECDITVPYDQVGLDPRYIRDAELYVYLGNGDPVGNFDPVLNSQRFVGMAKDVSRKFTKDEKSVVFKALDYTTLFLEMKNFPASGLPDLTQSLPEAWEQICDNTGYVDLDTGTIVSSVTNLRDKLEYWGPNGPTDVPDTALGDAMPARLRALGKLDMNGEADAWAVWKKCCEQLGLITFIRGDRCVITNATDYFTADDPPLFVYGFNVETLEESRDLGKLSAKNVCVRSYDPLTSDTYEALFPDPANPLARKHKRLGASAKKAPKSVKSQEYDCFDLPFACTDQEVLTTIAQRIWYERVRQELSGKLSTADMIVPTVGSAQELNPYTFDILSLMAGDAIQVKIERAALDAIQALETVSQRVAALQGFGYSDDMVQAIANATEGMDTLPGQFLCHQVVTEVDFGTGDSSCSFKVDIEYVNRISIDDTGSATTQDPDAPITGTSQPAISGQT